jgi:CHAT domain-containing protein
VDYIKILVNIGSYYRNIGDYSRAEKCYLKSLKISKSIFGPTNRIYSSSLAGLGLIYSELKEYSKAEEYYLESLEVIKNTLGENNLEFLRNHINLGILYYDLEDYTSAERCYLKSLEIIKNTLGEYNIYYAKLLHNIGMLYVDLQDYSKAKEYYYENAQILQEDYLKSIDYMTEKQRESYWHKIGISYKFAYPYFVYKYYFINPSISTFAYVNELFTKGLLLASTNEVRNSILKSGDSVLIKQWNELIETKQVVMHLEEKDPSSSQLEIYRHRADSLEKQMTISSVAFRESKEQWNINWESVKKQLSKNEVAIEYFSAPLSQDSTMYCALLLRHNSKYPELIPLFEEKEVTDITSTINESIDNSLLYNNKYGATLSEKVWSKILPRVKEGETIYFSPSGLLHQLAIEFLPVDSASTMSDIYNMVRLSSTREIVTNKSKESYKSAVVYGGIHYDLDNNVILEESNRYPEVKHRTLENDSINRGSAKFLPGTKEEAERINKLLSDNKIEVKFFKTKTANEESFKSLSGKHNNILHIATHGFTWTDSTAREQDYFADRMKMQLMGDNKMRGPVIDPLDRCGLLFAGANTALQGKSKELPDGVQDGILTAQEISLMDLRDAELVVLSACETAKGDITSEGVFGLQRAFKMAGVKTIIMSLWKVDDSTTQLLMTEFYNNWIIKGLSKREAFKNAQNTVRYYKDEHGDCIYKDRPYYWAGFIMLD